MARQQLKQVRSQLRVLRQATTVRLVILIVQQYKNRRLYPWCKGGTFSFDKVAGFRSRISTRSLPVTAVGYPQSLESVPGGHAIAYVVAVASYTI